MSGLLLHSASHHRHVVTKDTYTTLARELTLAYREETIFVNRCVGYYIYRMYAFYLGHQR